MDPWVGIFLSPLNANDGLYLSHPHTYYGFFLREKKRKRLPENPEYAEIRHTRDILTSF